MMTNDPKQNEIPPPPRRVTRGLNLQVPKPADAPDNLSVPNSGFADMNFKMPVDFHKAFKLAAVMRNMQMRELLDASFRAWVDLNGDDTIKSALPATTSFKAK